MVKIIDSSVVAGAIRLYFGDKVSDVLPLSCSYNKGCECLDQVLTVFFSDGIPSVNVGVRLDKNGLKYSVFGDTYASVAEKSGSEIFSCIHLNHVSLCKAIEEYRKLFVVENLTEEEYSDRFKKAIDALTVSPSTEDNMAARVKYAFLHSGKEAEIIREMYLDSFDFISPNGKKYVTFLKQVEADGRMKELDDILKRYGK